MEYRYFADTYVVRLERGEEVMDRLSALCRQEHITLASVQAIGAVDHAVMGVYDVETKVYHRVELNEPLEITALLGNVTLKDDEVYLHLHVTLGNEEGKAFGGHVNELRISATCEMFVRTLPGAVGRRHDDVTGLNLFDF
ncbi:MAG: DNA-binding protein [Clostridia bacterium]|nr:DNA-binding protein [Clostridia bacterium]